MTINRTSRYVQGEVLWINTKRHGRKQTVYLNTVVTLSRPYVAFLEREGDTLSNVAYKAYQNEQRWWYIADANPQLFYPLDIRPGQLLRLPS